MTKEIQCTEISNLSDFFILKSDNGKTNVALNQIYNKLYSDNYFNYNSKQNFHICFTFNNNSLDLTMESILLALSNNTILSIEVRNKLGLDNTMNCEMVYEKFKNYEVTKMYIND